MLENVKIYKSLKGLDCRNTVVQFKLIATFHCGHWTL